MLIHEAELGSHLYPLQVGVVHAEGGLAEGSQRVDAVIPVDKLLELLLVVVVQALRYKMAGIHVLAADALRLNELAAVKTGADYLAHAASLQRHL